jgi:hypothetical protein
VGSAGGECGRESAGGECGRVLVELHGLAGTWRNENDFALVELPLCLPYTHTHTHTHTPHTHTLRQGRRKREARCARNTSGWHIENGRLGLRADSSGSGRMGCVCCACKSRDGGGRDFSGISRATCSGHSNTFCHGARRMRRILNEAASVPAQAHKNTNTCMHARTHIHTRTQRLWSRAHASKRGPNAAPLQRLTPPNRGGPARIPRHEEERASACRGAGSAC